MKLCDVYKFKEKNNNWDFFGHMLYKTIRCVFTYEHPFTLQYMCVLSIILKLDDILLALFKFLRKYIWWFIWFIYLFIYILIYICTGVYIHISLCMWLSLINQLFQNKEEYENKCKHLMRIKICRLGFNT